MTSTIIKYIEEKPLAAGLLSLIAGLIIGILVPASKSEADLIEGIRQKAAAREGKPGSAASTAEEPGA